MRRGSPTGAGLRLPSPAPPPGPTRPPFRHNPTVTSRHRIPRGMLVAATACALCLPATARVAFALTFLPGVDVAVRQDQLPGEASGSEGWIARVSPRLALARIAPSSTLELTGIRSFDSNERLAGPVWVGDEAGLRFQAHPSPYS